MYVLSYTVVTLLTLLRVTLYVYIQYINIYTVCVCVCVRACVRACVCVLFYFTQNEVIYKCAIIIK